MTTTDTIEVSSVAGQELRQYVETHQRLEAQKKDITELQAENLAEAKGRGYDVKVLRKIFALLKMDPDERAELDAVTETYLSALGL